MGMFYRFLEEDVKLIGVEAAGLGLQSDKHCASLTLGSDGIFQGMRTYVLQNEDGQINEVYSVSAGLDYPGVGPEHSFLKDSGKVNYVSVTDDEALKATVDLSRFEGILPALESAHAVAYLEHLMPKTNGNQIVVVNISGRGDKDLNTIIKYTEEKL
jgi:tryptophan synthase beta chain